MLSLNPTDTLIQDYERKYNKTLVQVPQDLNNQGVCFALSFYWIYLIRSEKAKVPDSKDIIEKLKSIKKNLLSQTNKDLNKAISSLDYKQEIKAWFNTKVAWKFDLEEIVSGNSFSLGDELLKGLNKSADPRFNKFFWHMVFGFDYTYKDDGRSSGHTTAILRVAPSEEYKFFDPNIGIFTFPGAFELAEWLCKAYWPYKSTTRNMTKWDLRGISAQKF